MSGLPLSVRHAYQGAGAAFTFELHLGDTVCACLLDAGRPDAQGRELLVRARSLLSGLLAEGRRQGESTEVFLGRVLGSAAGGLAEFLRERGWDERPPLGVGVLLGDARGLWVAEAGALRVLLVQGGEARPILEPRTVAQRMADDGLVPSAGDAPEAFRSVPVQGLGMNPRDFEPRIRGPFSLAQASALVLENLAVASLLHPSEYQGQAPDEAALWRHLRFCASKDAQASPALLVLAQGSRSGASQAEDLPPVTEAPRGLSRLPWLFGAVVLGAFLLLILLGLWMLKGETPEASSTGPAKVQEQAVQPPPMKTLFKDKKLSD